MTCGVGCRLGSDPELLWLCPPLPPVAIARIRPLALGTSICRGSGPRNGKKTKTKQTRKNVSNLMSINFNPLICFWWGFLVCFVLFCLVFLPFLGLLPTAYGGSQARDLIEVVATGLCHSHSNTGSKPCLCLTPQLTAMPDP